MDLRLSEDIVRLIQEKVKSGRYRSAQEVISKALQLLDNWDQELDSQATAFKAEIEGRLARGPATPLDFSELKRSIRREVEARRTGPRE